MQPTRLRLTQEESIPVRVATADETTLLECDEPLPFLAHVTQGRWTAALSPDVFLRGVVLPHEGAHFQLCDPFGIVADEVVTLTDQDARTLILDRLW